MVGLLVNTQSGNSYVRMISTNDTTKEVSKSLMQYSHIHPSNIQDLVGKVTVDLQKNFA